MVGRVPDSVGTMGPFLKKSCKCIGFAPTHLRRRLLAKYLDLHQWSEILKDDPGRVTMIVKFSTTTILDT